MFYSLAMEIFNVPYRVPLDDTVKELKAIEARVKSCRALDPMQVDILCDYINLKLDRTVEYDEILDRLQEEYDEDEV